MQEILDVLQPFYMSHMNIAGVGILILLLAIFLASRKNTKGVILVLCVFLVYNLVIFNKTKRNPDWYDETEAKFKGYDPVKELWNERPADDDVNKRK